MISGCLIVFEGPDGCGKTTLSQGLVARLQASRQEVLWDSFPGRKAGTVGEWVYRLHHDEQAVQTVDPLALQALHVAAHLDAINQRFIPILKAGKTLVLDRFWWSTWAYGRVDEVNTAVLDALIGAEKLAWAGYEPRRIFLVRRERPFREEYPQKWAALNRAYDELSSLNQDGAVVTILNDSTIGAAMNEIDRSLADLP